MVEAEDAYEFRIFGTPEAARVSGIHAAEADALFDPDPSGCDWNCEINSAGGFIWTCTKTTCTGECKVWIREPGGTLDA